MTAATTRCKPGRSHIDPNMQMKTSEGHNERREEKNSKNLELQYNYYEATLAKTLQEITDQDLLNRKTKTNARRPTDYLTEDQQGSLLNQSTSPDFFDSTGTKPCERKIMAKIASTLD
jgi:hypothetical protein